MMASMDSEFAYRSSSTATGWCWRSGGGAPTAGGPSSNSRALPMRSAARTWAPSAPAAAQPSASQRMGFRAH